MKLKELFHHVTSDSSGSCWIFLRLGWSWPLPHHVVTICCHRGPCHSWGSSSRDARESCHGDCALQIMQRFQPFSWRRWSQARSNQHLPVRELWAYGNQKGCWTDACMICIVRSLEKSLMERTSLARPLYSFAILIHKTSQELIGSQFFLIFR